MEGLVELGRPAVGLGLGCLLPLLVREVRSDQVGLHERTEHAGRDDPLEVVGCHHCKVTRGQCCSKLRLRGD